LSQGAQQQQAQPEPSVVVFAAVSEESAVRAAIVRVAGRVPVVVASSGPNRLRVDVILPVGSQVQSVISSLQSEGLQARPWLPRNARPPPGQVARMPRASAGLSTAIHDASGQGVGPCVYWARSEICPFGSSCRFECY
jgi:hypothetical protein